MEKTGGGSAGKTNELVGARQRPTTVDLEDFEDCYSEPQWWHYQIMAINSKFHFDQML
jgi:hypothetical protein